MGIREVFDKYADIYDRTRRQLVPCFDEFYACVVDLIPFSHDTDIHIADLGAGTGLLTMFLAEAFPRARFTLIDVSTSMLERARQRFSFEQSRFHFVEADYARIDLDGPFDVVASALSIHHLEDSLKQRLMRTVYTALVDDGVFINADQIRGITSYTDSVYRENWLRAVRESGVSEADLDAALERMREDKNATLDDQLEWMRQAGLSEVNCWFKTNNLVVYSGKKKKDSPTGESYD